MGAIKLNVLENGNLMIEIDNQEDFDQFSQKSFGDERGCLYELMDNARYIGNDWHCPNNLVLTETPAIGRGAIYPDDDNYDGEPVDYEHLWYFSDYMIKSFMDILSENSRVVFQCHK